MNYWPRWSRTLLPEIVKLKPQKPEIARRSVSLLTPAEFRVSGFEFGKKPFGVRRQSEAATSLWIAFHHLLTNRQPVLQFG
jgi:hypothetical protein